jgi:hypothetical protein
LLGFKTTDVPARRRKEAMKYDIDKYKETAQKTYADLSNPDPNKLFCGSTSYWKVGNVFDTMTDYLFLSGDDPATIATDTSNLYPKLGGRLLV